MCKGTEAWYSRLVIFVDYHLTIWDFKKICDEDHYTYEYTFVCLHMRVFSLPILLYFQYNILQRDNIFTTFLHVAFHVVTCKQPTLHHTVEL